MINAQFPVHEIKYSKQEALVASKEEKRQTRGEELQSKVWSLNYFFSGSFTIMLQSNLEPIFSELICKHWVLPEAAEAGHFTFPFSQRELSGRYRYTMLHQTGWIPRDCCWKIQFKFHVWRVNALKNAWHTEKLLLLLFSGSPAGLCIFKVSHKSQKHIAVCSGLIIKKWVQMVQLRKSWK